MERTEHNHYLEQMIRRMATEGMEEWMEKRKRRMRTTTTVVALLVAAVTPVISYASAPSPRYEAYCSTSDDTNIKAIQHEAADIYGRCNNNIIAGSDE